MIVDILKSAGLGVLVVIAFAIVLFVMAVFYVLFTNWLGHDVGELVADAVLTFVLATVFITIYRRLR